MPLKSLLPLSLSALLVVAPLHGQGTPTVNPPYPSANPYSPRGHPVSPDGKYSWVVKTADPVSYQLFDSSNRTLLLSVPSYFAASRGNHAIKYARAFGIYWNANSTLVALDELNYRRAGFLYFFFVDDDIVKRIPVDSLVPRDVNASETRLCADRGWISLTEFSIRAATLLSDGNFESKYFTIDFTDPLAPRVKPGNP